MAPIEERGNGRPVRAGRSLAAGLAALAALATASSDARAGGLYASDRGVRPLARAGAFIAGGDDLGAIAYNPAGLFDAGAQLMIDAGVVGYSSEYTRQAILRQVDPNTGATTAEFQQTFPTVEGSTPFIPIPTLALSLQPTKELVVAVGAWAPYAAITTYPEELDDGRAAPQRYSLITLEGSALAVVGAWGAFAPSKEWRVGAGIEVLAGSFNSRVVFSGCVPDRFFCAPEQPEWDVLSELKVGPIVAPSGKLGAIWIPAPWIRAGLAGSLPYFVRAAATVRTRLPSTPVFERASQEGEDADVSFDLPWTLKAGVEVRPVDDLRVELGFGYEGWSMHDQIKVEPDGIALKNVAGFPETYYIPDVVFPRNFQDAISVRLGGEYTVGVGGNPLDLRGGVSYESSAVPPEWLSVLTIDSSKVTTALGLGLHVGRARFDFTFAHVFSSEVTVDPREAKVPQVSPVNARPPARPDIVNGGVYSASTNVFGLGFAYTFDPPPAELAPPPLRRQ